MVNKCWLWLKKVGAKVKIKVDSGQVLLGGFVKILFKELVH